MKFFYRIAMNKIGLFILAILIGKDNYAQSPNSRFDITGVLQGFADSTSLYLDIVDNAGVDPSDKELWRSPQPASPQTSPKAKWSYWNSGAPGAAPAGKAIPSW